jgi:hypothetical protein
MSSWVRSAELPTTQECAIAAHEGVTTIAFLPHKRAPRDGGNGSE